MDDHELLRDYVEKHSEKAFCELVERHLPMVYSVAQRAARDAHLAEEIAQDVFRTLAKKGSVIRPPQVIGGWLYNTTRHLAMHAVRAEQRRRERESTVIMQIDETHFDPKQLHENLEPAMAELNENDRDTLVLRFLENRSLREVGAELGISEDAARMRVNRALEQLRGVFSRQGITVTSVLLGTFLASSTSSAVPAGLAVAISTSALAAGATFLATITQTTITTMNWINTKTVAAIVAAAILAGTGTYLTQRAETKRLRAENDTLIQENEKLAAARDAALVHFQSSKEALAKLDKDTRELLRLRNEVGQLRQQNEVAKLASEQKALEPVVAKPARKPGSYISKDQLAFAGYATPEDAYESMTWATMTGNFDVLISSLSPEIRDKIGSQLRENYEKEFTEEKKAKFKGIQFLAKKFINDYTVELKMHSDGERDFVQRMIKFGDEWKLSGGNPYDANWEKEGQIETFSP